MGNLNDLRKHVQKVCDENASRIAKAEKAYKEYLKANPEATRVISPKEAVANLAKSKEIPSQASKPKKKKRSK
jgi:hypothetical protein